jgi:hypothetical protein
MEGILPQKANGTGAGNFYALNKKVLAKMKQTDPDFDWSPYDSRLNRPNYTQDASLYAPDNKPDYVIIFYRYRSGMSLPFTPFLGMGGGKASSHLSVAPSYNNYTFDDCGFTISTVSSFYNLFIHEVAHTLYHCPHYAYANLIVGNYFYNKRGWGMMMLGGSATAFPCALGWERWYLNWVEDIKANNVPADIQTASDLNANGEYVLRDYMSTGDMIRIKIPNTGGRNQQLWLENHQGITLFDTRKNTTDGCNNPYPQSLTGVTAYIESIVGKNIYIGKNVTASQPQGDVIITTGAHVLFVAAENIHIDEGFECNAGATYEIRN